MVTPSSTPTDAQWAELLARTKPSSVTGKPGLDVVVPVYRGYEETARCLFTLIGTIGQNGHNVVVVNDRSPDRKITDLVERLAGAGCVDLITQEENSGFVASVNAGMSLHADRDIILLNSDTEVFGDWATRLRSAVYADDNIATATPFSNNATICSYPEFPNGGDCDLEIGPELLDRLTRSANRGLTVDLPTAVGFCMYIRRECLETFGDFDEETFGLGYGEENDFSQRVAAKGWRNVLAADVFVPHVGSVSFGELSSPRSRDAASALGARYPLYHRQVQDFISADPPAVARGNLDCARMRHAVGDRPAVLMILHHMGGGTVQHVEELATGLDEVGIASIVSVPSKSRPGALELYPLPRVEGFRAIRMDVRHGSFGSCLAILEAANVRHIHVHHLLGNPEEMFEFLPDVVRALDVEVDFTAHDYTAACPRITMITGKGEFCNNFDLEVCERCIGAHGSEFGDVSAWYWRSRYGKLLRTARKVFAPSESAKEILQGFYSEVSLSHKPHKEIPPTLPLPAVRRRLPKEHLRVAVVGAISYVKGSHLLLQCATDAHNRGLPLKFVLLGAADNEDKLRDCPNVEIEGRYRLSEVHDRILRLECHLALLPAIWPETYNYTLTQVLACGLFPVSFDIGAIAERTRRYGWGFRLPISFVRRPAALNNMLLSCEIPDPPDNLSDMLRELSDQNLADYYYRDVELAPLRPRPVDQDPAGA